MLQREPDRILNSSVLVLNRNYMALHVVSVRRAFALLYADTAEVIDIEDGQYFNYDFESWCEVSILRREEMQQSHLGGSFSNQFSQW